MMEMRSLFVIPPEAKKFSRGILVNYVPLALGVIASHLRSEGLRNVWVADMRDEPVWAAVLRRVYAFVPAPIKEPVLEGSKYYYYRMKAHYKFFMKNTSDERKKQRYVLYARGSHTKDTQVRRFSSKDIEPKHRRNLRSLMSKYRPQVVGFSALSYEQLYASVYLSMYLKKMYPDVKVILGGPFVSKHVEDLIALNKVKQSIDFIIVGDAEDPLRDLLYALEKNTCYDDVANLYYRSGKKFIRSRRHFCASFKHLRIVPDFRGIKVLQSIPIRASLGCYWGKCTYCSYKREESKTIFLPVAELVDMIRQLKHRYRIQKFQFRDDALPPRYLMRFSQELLKKNVNISWGCYVCCDKGFTSNIVNTMKRAGCTYTLMGLESASAHVLKEMGKMQRLCDMVKTLKTFKDVGLPVTACTFIGFPTETHKDICMTLDFFREHKDLYAGYSAYHFSLEPSSEVFKNPTKYGISSIRRIPFRLDVPNNNLYTFKTETGITSEDVEHYISMVHDINRERQIKG